MCNSINCDRLDDDFSDLFGGEIEEASAFARKALSSTTSLRTFEETCPSCRGTGQFRSYSGRIIGQCFKCKGAGKLRFKTAPEQRAKARDAADTKRREAIRTAHTNANEWLEANPDEAKWLRDSKARGFEFAVAMDEALFKFGHFTPKQEAAVRNATAKSLERQAQWAAEREAREANKADVDIGRIATAFTTAKQNGLKFPKLRLADFTFSLASAAGRNAGSIYVKDGETYLGKITDGKFTRSRDCTAETEASILAVCADPEAAAVAYGQRTGQCSCCGRELTNAESIARSIGPICAEKWGW